MYTSSIVEKKFQSGTLSVAVKFSNSDDSFVEWFSTKSVANPLWLNDAVRNRLEEVNACKSFIIPSVIDVSLPPAPIITTEEKERRKWANGLQKLVRMKELIDIGIIAVDDPEYVLQKGNVKKLYQSSFII